MRSLARKPHGKRNARPTHVDRSGVSRCRAVAEGFEPSEGLPPHTLSRRAPSAARTHHRARAYPTTRRAVEKGVAGVELAGSTLVSTHIGAKPGEIAERVLLPGDPLRAKWIAETYLQDARCYSTVRGMLGYTGHYQGVAVSVQGSGMGMPSASIYLHELLTEYGVRSVIRVGSCGALIDDLDLRDVLAANAASTDSNMNRVRFSGLVDYAPVADFRLLRAAVDVAERRGVPLRIGPVLSTDAFYP